MGSADPLRSAKALTDKPGSAGKGAIKLEDGKEPGRSGYRLRSAKVGVSSIAVDGVRVVRKDAPAKEESRWLK